MDEAAAIADAQGLGDRHLGEAGETDPAGIVRHLSCQLGIGSGADRFRRKLPLIGPEDERAEGLQRAGLVLRRIDVHLAGVSAESGPVGDLAGEKSRDIFGGQRADLVAGCHQDHDAVETDDVLVAGTVHAGDAGLLQKTDLGVCDRPVGHADVDLAGGEGRKGGLRPLALQVDREQRGAILDEVEHGFPGFAIAALPDGRAEAGGIIANQRRQQSGAQRAGAVDAQRRLGGRRRRLGRLTCGRAIARCAARTSLTETGEFFGADRDAPERFGVERIILSVETDEPAADGEATGFERQHDVVCMGRRRGQAEKRSSGER